MVIKLGIKLIYTNNSLFKIKSYKKEFNRIAAYVYNYLKLKHNYELSVTITDDETIREYNHQYRNIDRATDVLSFAFLEQGLDEKEILYDQDAMILLGDIIISSDKAKQQANDYGHSFDREMAFLFTHGLLHLLGYDHNNHDEEKEMFSLQEKILQDLDIKREEN